MALHISPELMQEIQAHGESAYPEEGAGLMLGTAQGELKLVTRLVTFANAREQSARHNRYLLTPQDYLRGEQEAARLELDVCSIRTPIILTARRNSTANGPCPGFRTSSRACREVKPKAAAPGCSARTVLRSKKSRSRSSRAPQSGR
jgi:hypothetical protein